MSAAFPHALRVSEVAARFDGEVRRGDGGRALTGLASLGSAGSDELSFVATASMRQAAASSGAGALLISETLFGDMDVAASLIVVQDAYASYARVARWIDAARDAADVPLAGVHASAVVAADAVIAPDACIGAHCSIGAGARIGVGARLGPGCVLGRRAVVGAHTRLHPNVTLADDCVIGARGIVHSGTVIGSDGFGFAPVAGAWEKIPQLGSVRIGDDVEIGANCSVDRGALDDTVIADGCKLDNLIQIAHNVRIGAGTAIAGCVGVAGSAVIGRRCRIGGGAGILGHLEICDDVTISAMSLVSRSIREPGFYTGVFPLMSNPDWERSAATLKRLPELRARLRDIEKRSDHR